MSRRLFWTCAIVIAFALGAWSSVPPLASALSLDMANVSLARAYALPDDSPERTRALAEADRSLAQA